MSLTRDDILAISDVVIEKLEMQDWGGDVYIKTISGADYVALQALKPGQGDDEDPDSLEKVIVIGTCDEKGTCLFNNDDIPALKNKAFKNLERLSMKILELNGLSTQQAEEAEKN